jgi:hypothetical protein
MPTGIVNDEQLAFGVQSGYFFGQVIRVTLEDIGIDSVKDHLAALPGSRTHRAKDVGSDMVSEIKDFSPTT